MKLPSETVAEGWMDLNKLDVDSDDYQSGNWAFDILFFSVQNDPLYAFDICLKVLELDSSYDTIGYLNVSFLSDLILENELLLEGYILSELKTNANFTLAIKMLKRDGFTFSSKKINEALAGGVSP